MPSPVDFFTQYIKQHKPVLLKGAAFKASAADLFPLGGCPCHIFYAAVSHHVNTRPLTQHTHLMLPRAAFATQHFANPADWTDEGMFELFGHTSVDFEKGKKEIRGNGGGKASLREFLKTYRETDVYLVNDLGPEMMDRLLLPSFISCGGADTMLSKTIMWMSSGGTSSVLHNDASENINCLLDGTKTLVMFNASHRDSLETEACGWTTNGAFSAADSDKIDLTEYPGFKGLDSWDATMETGDCLYIPVQWYHHVKSPGPRNLAINVWFQPFHTFHAADCQANPSASMTLNQQHWFDGEDYLEQHPRLEGDAAPVFRTTMALANRLGNHGRGLTRGEFVTHVQKTGPQRVGKPSVAYLEGIFTMFDREGDGYLWQDELSYGFHVSRTGVSASSDPSPSAVEEQLRDWRSGVLALVRIGAAPKFNTKHMEATL